MCVSRIGTREEHLGEQTCCDDSLAGADDKTDELKAAGVSRKLGVVGFCYGGGRLVEALARDAEGCFSMGICFYGSRMDASLGDRIAVPMLFVCGNGDPLCPEETV